jgi:CNT family concentrative nucleoside transporter
MERMMSVVGLFSMVGMAWLMSAHKRKVNLRIVTGGMLLQFGLALLILKTAYGQFFFSSLGGFFRSLLDYVDAGSGFVFGEGFEEHFFAFKVLPTIIFFSSLMSVLYHLRLIQPVVALCASVMQKTLGTSGAESLSAAANIFVGQTEAPLVIRPYVSSMTRSELMAIMVGGFATIAGGVLAAFVGMGIDAGHLVTASVISAPAALLIAKVLQPEVERPKTLGRVELNVERSGVNVIDAIASGATDGLKLALNVGAMLIVFLAMIALIDGSIGWIGNRIEGFLPGVDGAPRDLEWSLSAGLGYLFAPFAFLMGIESGDCLYAGELLGKKMVANEFVAYSELGRWIQPGSGVQLQPRTVLILTYALCGFANFSSIGIQLGGIGGIAPERRQDLARLALRAMLGGTLAAFMTACVVGILT